MTDRTYPDDFEAFWRAYAYSRSKPAALRAFRSAVKRASLEILIEGAKRYKAERQNTERCYWKHPATWLNNDCWEDEPIEAPKSKEDREWEAKMARIEAQYGKPKARTHEGNVVSMGTAAKRVLADLERGEAKEKTA